MEKFRILISFYIMQKYKTNEIKEGSKAFANYVDILEYIKDYSKINKKNEIEMIEMSRKLIEDADNYLETKFYS